MLCEILLEQKIRSPKFRTDTPIILKIPPKSVSYELLLALRCFVNMGPGNFDAESRKSRNV